MPDNNNSNIIKPPTLTTNSNTSNTTLLNNQSNKVNKKPFWKDAISSIFVRGALINALTTVSIIMLFAIPLALLISFMTALGGVNGTSMALELLGGLALEGLALGAFWGLLNAAALYVILAITKNKLLSDLLAPILLAIGAFILLTNLLLNGTKEAGMQAEPFVYAIVVILITINIITSIILNRRSRITINSFILKKKQKALNS